MLQRILGSKPCRNCWDATLSKATHLSTTKSFSLGVSHHCRWLACGAPEMSTLVPHPISSGWASCFLGSQQQAVACYMTQLPTLVASLHQTSPLGSLGSVGAKLACHLVLLDAFRYGLAHLWSCAGGGALWPQHMLDQLCLHHSLCTDAQHVEADLLLKPHWLEPPDKGLESKLFLDCCIKAGVAAFYVQLYISSIGPHTPSLWAGLLAAPGWGKYRASPRYCSTAPWPEQVGDLAATVKLEELGAKLSHTGSPVALCCQGARVLLLWLILVLLFGIMIIMWLNGNKSSTYVCINEKIFPSFVPLWGNVIMRLCRHKLILLLPRTPSRIESSWD